MLFIVLTVAEARAQTSPVTLGIVGLAHDQAGTFLTTLRGRSDARLVGIVETNQELIAQYQRRFSLGPDLFYTNFDELRQKARPEAVASFTRTIDHRAVVEACAAAGLDVLLEKPLA